VDATSRWRQRPSSTLSSCRPSPSANGAEEDREASKAGDGVRRVAWPRVILPSLLL
jgi:hypothetical protein